MSDDTLAMLLREARSQLDTERIAPIDEEREISEWLAARGVVVLPPDHPFRTGEPSAVMIDAALTVAHLPDTGLQAWREQMRLRLQAAFAAIRE